MKTVLLVTVGGSHQPIVTAIQTLNPDRVIFICSDGPKGSISQVTGKGSPCEVRKGSEVIERLPNIPTQMRLRDFDPDRDVVLLHNPDDFAECYAAITRKIAEINQTEAGLVLMADYTGGTKTMSVTLALSALDFGAKLMLTTGDRRDLIRVNRGEMTEQASIAPVVMQRVLEQDIPAMVADYNYAAALQKLRQLRVNQDGSPEMRNKIRQLFDLCSAFDAWDRFDHLEAWEALRPWMKIRLVSSLGRFLKQVIHSRGLLDNTFESAEGSKGHGYEIVQDLLLNAQRRAHQQRYDDAVGRAYRALELLAQVRLNQEYGIQTGNVNIALLPETLRPQYEAHRSHNGKIELPLLRSYQLLTQLEGDPVGQLFQARESLIKDSLKIRNASLFAHGFRPITRPDFEQTIETTWIRFIQDTLTELVGSSQAPAAPQLPTQPDEWFL
jgi:CRISPR-associated protein (TIGR02710 family)